MLYIDTSLLVSAFSTETMSARAQAWLLEQDHSQLSISDWTVTEVSSALALKLRGGEISQAQRSVALASFRRLMVETLEVLPVAAAHYRAAAGYADQHGLGLRAGDALHLAIAADHGATLHTLDRRQAEAGPALGISTSLLA